MKPPKNTNIYINNAVSSLTTTILYKKIFHARTEQKNHKKPFFSESKMRKKNILYVKNLLETQKK